MENIFFFLYPRMYLVEDTFIGYVYKVRDKMDLFLNLSKALVFPNYFGENWDALCEVYRDFDWISNNDIVIIHEDLSLLDEYDLRMYLKIIKITLSFWAGFNDHSVCFIFSEKDKKRIMDVVDLMK